MTSSPTLSLCLILKNEEKNLPRLLDSVEGLMDEIVVVDTGSTDRTKEIAESRGCKVYDFEWVDSFEKARNFAFSHATMDYILWLDGDDELHNKEAFLQWKLHCMQHADVFLATYHYALKDGVPIISFMRERVFKRSLKPTWQYDIHEGIILKPDWKFDYATSWAVNHLRDAEDVKADRSRNIKIIEKIKAKKGLDARLQFYYGKELFEAGRPHESIPEFDRAIESDKIEPHDKILAYQYVAYSCVLIGDSIKDEFRDEKHRWYKKAIAYDLDGLKQDPTRAEFYVNAGDSYLKMGDLVKAKPFYAAAKNCLTPQLMGSKVAAAVYSFKEFYGELPALQLAKINLNLGLIPEALSESNDCYEKHKNEEAKNLIEQLNSIKKLVTLDGHQEQTEDIVISCPPNQAYPFDEEIYKTKPLGGSETALVQMARHLKIKTGRTVKVFNVRETDLVSESGVEYISNGKANDYFSKNKPHTHIAWRHNVRLTNAPSYLWGHDLITPTVENVNNFDKMLCLSEFHKSYTMGRSGVPAEKIIITRNGIDAKKLDVERKPKNPNKIVWMSSPDRGLDKAMLVCDEVLKENPDIELHVYYGIENLYKYGPHMAELADKLKAMMAWRPYVKYHGFTEQSQMYQEVSDAVVWCHPCNFIETFCITALEMLALGIFPVTRRLGALANTLAEAEANHQAIMLEHDAITEVEIKAYATAVSRVLKEKLWRIVKLDKSSHDWSTVADEWIEFMNLEQHKAGTTKWWAEKYGPEGPITMDVAAGT